MTVELGALGGICAETLGAIAKKGVAAASKRSFARHEENNGTTKAFKQRELPFSEFTGLPHRSVAAQYGFVAKHFSSHKKMHVKSSSVARRGFALFVDGKVRRRRQAEKILDEIIPTAAN